MRTLPVSLLRSLVPLLFAAPLAAQTVDTMALGALTWRSIGPERGGRSVAVAGSSSRPNEYYMGTTGGGVFKTTDGGQSWAPVSDKYFGGTIGAIAVSESNPDIVYVGGGEFPIRGNVSHGDGVYKSTDAGKTWTYVGLVETRQIAKIRVHPRNPEIAYVAAFGPVWAPSSARGVFKTVDGGKTWTRVLFRNDSTGAIDLSMDPSNPDVLYAGLWQAYRKPWILVSGGAGSGLFKSTDAGRTWKEITRNPGLPSGIIGNVGISVSPANPRRVYAIIEADSGGVFRSDDGGDTWTRQNGERKLRQRAWYYTRIFADPKDENTVWVDNVQLWRSTDGGKTFPRPTNTPHGDHHDLWIAPNDSRRLGSADDGGVAISTDGGQHWTDLRYPTAQFYHVTTTTHFPYRVCGAQQDNSTACVPSKADFGTDLAEFYDVGGGESGWIAVRPDNPDIVFAGSYGGLLTRKDTRTGSERDVNPWPLNPMGHSAGDLKYRFQWTFPIVLSPHDPNTLYAGANVVFKSTDEGSSWQAISPDLTRHDPATLGPSGGPITRDQTSVEYYGTVFTIAESPVEKGTIWTGSDDGMVYVQAAGASWTNVTPKDLPEWTRISMVEASPHDKATAYVAGNRYQLNDNAPYIWKTADYGKSWTRITGGIAAGEFVRVVREDPVRKGLLFAGTERGVWVSFDDGAHWQRLQRNLPPVPVHDLTIKDGDLVAATHGRGFWILDDISTLRQLSAGQLDQDVHLYKPRDAWRIAPAFFGGGGANTGWNGAEVEFWLKKGAQKVTLDFLDAKGAVIRSFSSELDSLARADSLRTAARKAAADSAARRAADSLARLGVLPLAIKADSLVEPPHEGYRYTPPPRVPNKAGMNKFNWNLRAPEPAAFQGMIMWAAGVIGPVVPPGTYSVRLTAGDRTETQSFAVLKDPRTQASQADLDAQYEFLIKVRDKTSEANNAVRTIRNVKAQLAERRKRAAGKGAALDRLATALDARLSEVEGEIYQVRNRSGQDPLNYPIKLNNQIAALMFSAGSAEARPTSQSYEVFRLLSDQLDVQLGKLRQILDSGLGDVNAELTRLGLDKVTPSTAEVPAP